MNGSDTVVEEFHRLYYNSRRQTWGSTRWLGHRIRKCPLDLWVYQETLFELRPDLIIETGTFRGGSAFFLASICDLIGHGQILTIDVECHDGRPDHPRIRYLTGSSTDDAIVDQARGASHEHKVVMVLLDSDHSEGHVSRELALFSPMVSLGSYLVVEDTNINGHPVYPEFGPGPFEAVQSFLREHPEFVVDEGKEKLFLTFNPSGWLRRLTAPGVTRAGERRERGRERRHVDPNSRAEWRKLKD